MVDLSQCYVICYAKWCAHSKYWCQALGSHAQQLGGWLAVCALTLSVVHSMCRRAKDQRFTALGIPILTVTERSKHATSERDFFGRTWICWPFKALWYCQQLHCNDLLSQYGAARLCIHDRALESGLVPHFSNKCLKAVFRPNTPTFSFN